MGVKLKAIFILTVLYVINGHNRLIKKSAKKKINVIVSFTNKCLRFLFCFLLIFVITHLVYFISKCIVAALCYFLFVVTQPWGNIKCVKTFICDISTAMLDNVLIMSKWYRTKKQQLSFESDHGGQKKVRRLQLNG